MARAVKLGRSANLGETNPNKLITGGTSSPQSPSQKEKYECTRDSHCSAKVSYYICKNNKCIDPCTIITCAAGKRCTRGQCTACEAGATDCKCSSPAVANGAGGCIDSCNPNRCASTVPTCTRTGNMTTYACACTASSCGAGKQCSGGSCTNCTVNTACSCPSGQVATGYGSCMKPACRTDGDCGAGKQCLRPGTTTAACISCSANVQCTCPSGYLSNGSGSCVKPVCRDNTTCGAGRQCINPGKYNAACDPCPSGTQCTCPSGKIADGSGGCKTATCTSTFTLANGTVVDAKNIQEGGPNGVTGETACKNAGKRLPTLAELREMYQKQTQICNLTPKYDGGGWPYWSQRIAGTEEGYRIIFAGGSFGSKGAEQRVSFKLNSGMGAYIRCVSDGGYRLSTGAVVDKKNIQDGGPNGVVAETACKNAGKRLPTLAELREMYQNQSKIGNFTNTSDMGGWPYWSERIPGTEEGYRIIFAGGSFGSKGAEQRKSFKAGSGAGAYVRCVSK